MSNCSKSKCIINVIAVALFIFFYDFIVHGILLQDAYAATANLWRPESEMQSMGIYCIVIHLSLAFLYSALYKMSNSNYQASCATEIVPKAKSKNAVEEKKCCPMKRGLCFGTILGLILAVTNASAYMHLPIPASLAISWFLASLFQGVGTGVLLSLINNKKGCTANG